MVLLAGLLAGAMPLQAAPIRDFGCFYSHDGGPGTNADVRAAGPVFQQARGKSWSFEAVRPFFTRETDARGRTATDILWPLGDVRTWGGRSDWRFLTAFGHDEDCNDPSSAYRAWFLPFLFFGRNGSGEDYGAVFPLGGRIDNWFGRDEVSFVLFPLYAHSRLNDLETHHFLWPLVSRTTGKDTYQAKVFPFYGYTRRADAMERTFVLWPLWNQVRDRKPGATGGGFMLFPVFGHIKLQGQETWMVAPPFFRHTRSPDGTQGACPWPFVQWEKGSREKFYLWPLYGRRSSAGDDLSFWLWPVVWKGVTERKGDRRERFRVFPVYAQESREKTVDGASRVTERYVSVWPLVSYNRAGSNTMVRVLDLWPFRDTPAVERNLAPWWTFFDRRRTKEGTEGRVLWGLARWSAGSDGEVYRSLFPLVTTREDSRAKRFREWEFLKGAAGYQRDESGRTYRLLYFFRWRSAP